MCLMVESQKSYISWLEKFQSLTDLDDIILHIVQSDDDDHPFVATPLILFIKHIGRSEIFTFSFGHQDSHCPVPLDVVCQDIERLKTRKWVLDRKSFTETLPTINSVEDVNLLLFTEDNKIIDIFEFYTPAHSIIKRMSLTLNEPNKIIPLMKHLEVFSELCESIEKVIEKYRGCSDSPCFNLLNFRVIDIMRDLEVNGICVDVDKFKQHFGARIYKNNMVYSQYNLLTAAGRPSNRFGGVNYAALNKEDESRSCFVSRFGKEGKLWLVDYSAFHPRLICYIVGYDLPPGVVDIYRYLGEMYFRKKTLSDSDIEEAKKITFRQLYGGVEEKYQYIKYFVHLKDFVNKKWRDFQENGFVLTPWFLRKIDNKHLKDANPYKLFNYILQASELEMASPTIMKLNDYMKSSLSKPVLYTYDSLLFDIHSSESDRILPCIIDTMSVGHKLPVKTYCGDNYNNMTQIQ